MLWVDKHRPTRLSQLTYHTTLTQRLESLAADPGGLPHLLFYGPSGVGKKTRIMSLLRQVFGPGVERLRLDKRTFTTPTNRTVEINMITSNYHIEMAPGDAGLNDRYVIQDVIKEMASSKNIATVGMYKEKEKSPERKKKEVKEENVVSDKKFAIFDKIYSYNSEFVKVFIKSFNLNTMLLILLMLKSKRLSSQISFFIIL